MYKFFYLKEVYNKMIINYFITFLLSITKMSLYSIILKIEEDIQVVKVKRL